MTVPFHPLPSDRIPPTDAELLATVRAWLLASWEREMKASGSFEMFRNMVESLDSLPLSNVLSLSSTEALRRELNAKLGK